MRDAVLYSPIHSDLLMNHTPVSTTAKRLYIPTQSNPCPPSPDPIPQVDRAAANEELGNRMSVMESQIGKLEIVLGALPLWKEELVSFFVERSF